MRPWFDEEVKQVKLISSGEIPIIATVHPSSILRARDDESRHAEIARFIDDFRVVAAQIRGRRQAA